MAMRYFVIGANGELYGPADIPTLNQWIAEGRLLPTSMIQEELGGARFAASLLKELQFGASYPRPIQYGIGSMPGDQEVKAAWILGAVGFVCCSICAPIGLVYAIIAKNKKNPRALGPLIFCSIVTVVSIVWTIYYTKMGGIEGILRNLR